MQRFKLADSFIESYATRKVEFGFNGVGKAALLRTYARTTPTGREQWHEIVRRVTEGTFELERRHLEANDIPHYPDAAQHDAQNMYDKMFNLKFLPPGRGLAQMGAPTVMDRMLYAALYNCGFVDTADLHKDPIGPFTFFMEALMLGVGMGFRIRKQNMRVHPHDNDTKIVVVVEDSRLGWVKALEFKLRHRFLGEPIPEYDYSHVRPAGEPLKAFGGVASGPGPLRYMIEQLDVVFDKCLERGGNVDTILIADMFNHLGVCVVSGGVRRCLVKGTKVMTTNGPKCIQNVHCADYVHTTQGWAKVHTRMHQGKQKLMEIHTKMGPIECTPNHRIAVYTPTGYDWKLAGDLTTDDKLVFVAPSITDKLPPDSFDGPSKSVPTLFQSTPYSQWNSNIAWALGFLSGTSVELSEHKIITDGVYSFHTKITHPALSQQENYALAAGLIGLGARVNTVIEGPKKYTVTIVNVEMQMDVDLTIDQFWRIPHPRHRAAYMVGYKTGSQNNTVRKPNDIESLNIMRACVSLGIMSAIAVDGKKCAECESSMQASTRFGELKRDFHGEKQLSPNEPPRLYPIHICDIVRDGREEETYDLEIQGERPEFMLANGLLVHNSAEIAFGELEDLEFIHLKNYDLPEMQYRMNHGWTSNNSIIAPVDMDYEKPINIRDGESMTLAELIGKFGEPGFFWLENAQNYGRMCDPPDYKDKKAQGGNPCLEQTLEPDELCCLVETFLNRITDIDDLISTLECAYRYAKIVTTAVPHWPKTAAVAAANRRIGCSFSGIAQFVAKHGMTQLQEFCERGYDFITQYDRVLSEWYNVPLSIKHTSIKPSGTVSLLAGATPGVHYPISRFYLRRIRIQDTDPLVQELEAEGVRFEKAVAASDPNGNTMIAVFPVDCGEGTRSVKQVSLREQMELAAFMQRYWADNQVSFTGRFYNREIPEIPGLLKEFSTQLKGISFLSQEDINYEQLPYEEITQEQYEEELHAAEMRREDRVLRASTSSESSTTSLSRSFVGLTADSEDFGGEGCTTDACLARNSRTQIALYNAQNK